ncbi:MAG: hypothetical protein WC155_06040 [Candidatus Cloacimonadales bacterium]
MIEVTIDSSDIVRALKKYKTLLISTVLVCTAMAVAYSIWGTRYYDSKSIFRTLELENIIIPNVDAEFKNYRYLETDSNNPERINMYSYNLLKTNLFALKTIDKFNLKKYFKINESDSLKAIDHTLERYKKDLISFIYDEDSELVTIHVVSKDARFSYDILNYQYELLNDYYRNEFFKHKDKLISFLEARVLETTAQKEEIDARIKSYDEENMSFELDTKLEVLLKNYFLIYQEKLSNEIDLNIAIASYGADNPIAKDLARKDSLLTNQLADFSLNKSNDPAFLSFQNIPDHVLKHNKLLNEQSLYTNLLSYLRLIHESAKIDRLRFQEVMEIIDYPNIAGLHSKPKPALTIILTFFVSLLLTSTLIYNYDLYRRRDQN